MKHSEKKFLKRPEYPGGKEAFKAFVRENLVYPKEALEKGIEGIVYLHALIDDNGAVSDVEVDNGIGGGCDEEAVRLIRSIQFGKVKNRGVRVTTRKRFRIEFKLPPRVVYTGKPAWQATDSQTDKPVEPGGSVQQNPSDPDTQILGGEPAQQSPDAEPARENPLNEISSPVITYQVSQSKKNPGTKTPAQEGKKYFYSIRLKPGE